MSKDITYNHIADYFLAVSNSTGELLSNLKLQKLVYYAQAWHLAMYNGKPLFDNEFQAWVHGPVLVELYNEYKYLGYKPIVKDELDESYIAKFERDFSEETVFLNKIIEEYLSLSAYQLERLTHMEEPWLKARIGLQPDEPSHNIIWKEWMEEYYRKYL